MPECTACGLTAESLKRCLRCKSVSYCSKDCQSADWAVHKSSCAPDLNYLLRFQLNPDEINDPPVWRTLSVPATTTFAKLHRALQAAFHWIDHYSYEFVVNDPAYRPPTGDDALMRHIQRASQIDRLMGDTANWRGDPTEPRRFLLRVTDDAPEQPGFDPYWDQKKDRVILPERVHPRTPTKKASKTMIYKVLGSQRFQGRSMTYVYNLGETWRHELRVERTTARTSNISCVDGRGHPVIEGSGSSEGWNETLKLCRAFRAGKITEEQGDELEAAELGDALGQLYALKEKDGAEEIWDKDDINRDLAVLG